MRSLTCLLLVCFLQVIVVHGYGGNYGQGDMRQRCNQLLHSRLNEDALHRIDILIERFGGRAYNAMVNGYREISSRANSMSSAQVEAYLCNKVKSVVTNPARLSYVIQIQNRGYHCERVEGVEAQIFNSNEQRLAQAAANGKKAMIGLHYHRGALKWLGYQAISYSNWASGQPTNRNRYYYNHDCVFMQTDGKWKVGSCSLTDVLCEKRPIVCGATQPNPTRAPQPNPTRAPQPNPTKAPMNPTEAPKRTVQEKTKVESEQEEPKPVPPTLPSSGDLSALKDPATQTKILELSMNINYNLVKENSAAFSSSFMKAIRSVISPKLITIKKMRSGSTIITFTLTAPKDSKELDYMIQNLKDSYETEQFTVTFMNQTVMPTPGFKLKLVDEEREDHGGLSYVYHILIYIFVIVGILVAFTLIIVMVKYVQKHRLRTQPQEGSPPIFWVNGVATSDEKLGPPPEKDAPPAYSEAVQVKA